MKIDLNVLNSQQTATTGGAKKMKLSDNATSMVFQMFTKLIYSNPIGTVVREITSNCFDSHVEASQTIKNWKETPVVIKKSFDKETSTHYISFIDYGVGMSPERIEEVYMVYFESTKRVDNTQIGGFGIGGKTPLAYKRSTGQGEQEYDNSFYVITNYNGKKYYYCVYEGAESPEVSLLNEEETDEANGSEIRIPVLEKDLQTFEREMMRQLYYFENIIFEGFDKKDKDGTIIHRSHVTNDYQIIRGKTFWFRGENYNSNIHVCLGRVAYPINYDTINENSSDYELPVAIKLEVGDINVTASREELDYNENTIKVLKKKLQEVKVELVEMLKNQYSNVQTLEDYFNVKENFGRLKFPNGKSIYIGNVIKKDDVDYSNFKYAYMGKLPDDAQLFKLLFHAKLYGKKESSGYYSHQSFMRNYKGIQSARHLYYADGEFKRKVVKQAYLRTQHERFYIITKYSLDEIRLAQICEIFNVNLDSKFDPKTGKPVPFIKGLLEMQEEYFEVVRDNAENYDELEVPEDFILERKREKLSAETLKTTIPVRLVSGYYRSSYRAKIQDFVDFNGQIVYGFKDDDDKLRNVYELFKLMFNKGKTVTSYSSWKNQGFGSEGGIMFALISKGNEKYMKYCNNAYHVKDVYWKLLHRKVEYVQTFFMTYALEGKYGEISDFYKSKVIPKLSAKWGTKINRVKTYMANLPKKAADLSDYKYYLQKYFDIDNIEYTPEQKIVLAEIEKILELQKKNEKTLRYINFSYSRLDDVSKELLIILGKVLSF